MSPQSTQVCYGLMRHVCRNHQEYIMRNRYLIMLRTDTGFLQIGPVFITLESAQDALREYKRGPDADKTFRIFKEVSPS